MAKKVAPIYGVFDTDTGNLLAVSLSETGLPQKQVLLPSSPITIAGNVNAGLGHVGRLITQATPANAAVITIMEETAGFSYPDGSYIQALQLGAGALTFAAQNGNVTITGTPVAAGANVANKLVRVAANKWAYVN